MKKIGIIGAMDVEVALLKEKMSNITVTNKSSMDFYDGFIGNVPVTVVKCGVGKVNAAVCAQILCNFFNIEVIINTGVAGALMPSLKVGEIVISTDALQHDVNVTELGYQHGQIPGLTDFIFHADEKIVMAIFDFCKKNNIAAGVGRVLSGDQFISDCSLRFSLHEIFGGVCTEMEGAAIAQVAYLNKMPFVLLRTISDTFDTNLKIDYEKFEAIAAQKSADLLVNVLEIIC